MNRRVFLVRHGRTAMNAERRFVATTDPSLDATGRRQAAHAGAELSAVRLDAIVSSPLARCVETAATIGRAQTKTVDAELDARLVELGMGEFEGRSEREIETLGLGDLFRQWRQGDPAGYPSGAETFEAAAQRMNEVFDHVTSRGHESVAIVGHSHSLRILIATAVIGTAPSSHRRLRLDHASLSWIEWERETPRLVALNRTDFVEPLADC